MKDGLRLGTYLERPGDGRLVPRIPAKALLWALLIGEILREWSFHGIEALVRSRARRALGVSHGFGDDALAYFTERLDPGPTRQAAVSVLRLVKRNKAFRESWHIGLAVDGTGACRRRTGGCPWCHPQRDGQGVTYGHRHHTSMISVVGTGMSLPFDVEPWGPGDCEYNASQRLLRRAVNALGPRFADYVVGDGAYATSPFLHLAGDLGLRVVTRLKGNLPELLLAARQRFEAKPPDQCFHDDGDRVEVWDAGDFDPWETLRWQAVRVLRYRQHKADGPVVEAYWLTDFSSCQVSSKSLYRIAKSRWEIENQGFNDAKSRYGFEHTRHHHPTSLLVCWLLTILAMTIERLYRLRYLRRGSHVPRAAIDLVRLLRLALALPRSSFTNTS